MNIGMVNNLKIQTDKLLKKNRIIGLIKISDIPYSHL